MKMTNDMIDQMKNNLRSMAALRLPSPDGQPDLAHALDKMDISDLMMLADTSEWRIPRCARRFRSATYRLRPDYELEPEFLPCPNCGGKFIRSFLYDVEGTIFQRQCNHCQLAMESDLDQKEADRRWNTMARRLTI